MTIYLSGIQPTGKLHIGNYFGCIKPFISLVSTPVSKREKNVFLIADMHCFTKPRNVIKLNETIFDVARSLLAAGICSKNTRIVQQSKVSKMHVCCRVSILYSDFTTCSSGVVLVLFY